MILKQTYIVLLKTGWAGDLGECMCVCVCVLFWGPLWRGGEERLYLVKYKNYFYRGVRIFNTHPTPPPPPPAANLNPATGKCVWEVLLNLVCQNSKIIFSEGVSLWKTCTQRLPYTPYLIHTFSTPQKCNSTSAGGQPCFFFWGMFRLPVLCFREVPQDGFRKQNWKNRDSKTNQLTRNKNHDRDITYNSCQKWITL